MINSWYERNVICPRDHLPLKSQNEHLVCGRGHVYPLVDGVPVLLLNDVPQTMHVAEASLRRANGLGMPDERAPHLYLESLGIDDNVKTELIRFAGANTNAPVDPVVQYLVVATSGNMYKDLLGRLTCYPIPEIRVPRGCGERLLDIGCNWGRWSIAAAQAGYDVVGLDPSLGAVMAARRVCRQLGLPIHFVVADGRYLPFSDGSADVFFSYSVLQHLSEVDLECCIREANRVLKPGGLCNVQVANAFGVRSLYHQARRGFKATRDFNVRFRTPSVMKRLFERNIGETEILVDCYFGLGLQPADALDDEQG